MTIVLATGGLPFRWGNVDDTISILAITGIFALDHFAALDGRAVFARKNDCLGLGIVLGASLIIVLRGGGGGKADLGVARFLGTVGFLGFLGLLGVF
jgi:hypothetical protein